MQKKFLILPILFLLILSGCSLKNSSADANANANQKNVGGGPGWDRRPDFGQPDRAADITGLVKSIEGNQVTIIKLDRPQRATSTDQKSGIDQAQTQNEQNRTGNMTRTFSGGNGRVGPMMGGGRPGEESEESRAQMLEQLKKMSTGDVTVTIPVGIQMLKPDTTSSDDKQPTMAEASLTDIQADKMVNIWLDQSVTDKKVASFVLITR